MKNVLNTLSPTKRMILDILYEYRGMTFNQLVDKLAFSLGKTAHETYRRNAYKNFQDLTEEKLIVTDAIRFENKNVNFYYLTETGLQVAYEIRDLQPGYIGKGFWGDLGEFSYELQRPPKNNVLHHIMTTDVFLKINTIMDKHWDREITYRDNRYCSASYEIDGKMYRFRPDGEIEIGKKKFLLEVDRGSEYLEALQKKFLGYNNYFEWCEKNNKELPEGLIFITSSDTKYGINRRLITAQQAFLSRMTQWCLNFNMSFGTVDELGGFILSEDNCSEHNKQWLDIISFYAHGKNGVGKVQQLTEGPGKICNTKIYYNFVKTSNDSLRLFVYERYETSGTAAIIRLLETYQYFKSYEKTEFEFVPVLYYSEGQPKTLNFQGLQNETIVKKIFSNTLWLNIKSDARTRWASSNGRTIDVGNPLLQ